jgi:hypothetical protein
MTTAASNPETAVADALRRQLVNSPTVDARAALEALDQAGYAVVQLPAVPVAVEPDQPTGGITRARVGSVTARVRTDSHELRSIIGEEFLFTDPGKVIAYAAELIAMARWVTAQQTQAGSLG